MEKELAPEVTNNSDQNDIFPEPCVWVWGGIDGSPLHFLHQLSEHAPFIHGTQNPDMAARFHTRSAARAHDPLRCGLCATPRLVGRNNF